MPLVLNSKDSQFGKARASKGGRCGGTDAGVE